MIRIISGTAKGRRLQAPKNLPVRPTTDRAKEALFNILHHQFDFEECRILDLFSGTGNISYEFASRGVSQIMAVEQHKKCVDFIQKTTQVLDFPITVVQQEVLRFLDHTPGVFSIIFADPPYNWEEQDYNNLIEKAIVLLDEDGQFILEHEKHHTFETHPQNVDVRSYGQSVFSFFCKIKKAGR